MNMTGHIAGITETPLVKEGREQAKIAGKKAIKLGIDLIVTSPLSRALETAQIIAKEINYPVDKIHTSRLLLERDFGSAEGHPYAPDLDLDGFSDIEALNTLIERAHLSVRWIDSLPGNTVLVVGHGSFGRALRSVLTDHAFSNAEKIQNTEFLLWRA